MVSCAIVALTIARGLEKRREKERQASWFKAERRRIKSRAAEETWQQCQHGGLKTNSHPSRNVPRGAFRILRETEKERDVPAKVEEYFRVFLEMDLGLVSPILILLYKLINNSRIRIYWNFHQIMKVRRNTLGYSYIRNSFLKYVCFLLKIKENRSCNTLVIGI